MVAPFPGPVLADWSDFAAWKRGFLGAAATRGLRELYTANDPAVPAIDACISPARGAALHAAAEIAVPPVPHGLSLATFGEAVLARAHAIVAHVADAMQAEATAVQARSMAAAVAFLLSALSPHLRDELDDGKSPSVLWAEVHAKGYVLMDDCRLFGHLEVVRLAGNDALPDDLTTLEEHIQRYVDVIFVPSHGSDARLVAAADRLKVTLLCNACPPVMADVFETWRTDEPAWDYTYMRRRLVEYWALQRLGRQNATPPATKAGIRHATVDSTATDATFSPSSATAAIVRDVGASQGVPLSTRSSERGRREKRGADASSPLSRDSHGSYLDSKRPKTAPAPRDGPSTRARRAPPFARASPREHLSAQRADTVEAASPTRSEAGKAFSPAELAFLHAHAGTATTFQTIYKRGRAQSLFLDRSFTSVKCKLSRIRLSMVKASPVSSA